jgi:hypothetical protein
MIPTKEDKKRSEDFFKNNKDNFTLEEATNLTFDTVNSARVKRNFAEAMLADAKEKYKNDTMGLRSILLADSSNKPPTLDDYLKLGLSLSQLSESERESIQFMLDKLNLKPEDKK